MSICIKLCAIKTVFMCARISWRVRACVFQYTHSHTEPFNLLFWMLCENFPTKMRTTMDWCRQMCKPVRVRKSAVKLQIAYNSDTGQDFWAPKSAAMDDERERETKETSKFNQSNWFTVMEQKQIVSNEPPVLETKVLRMPQPQRQPVAWLASVLDANRATDYLLRHRCATGACTYANTNHWSISTVPHMRWRKRLKCTQSLISNRCRFWMRTLCSIGRDS